MSKKKKKKKKDVTGMSGINIGAGGFACAFVEGEKRKNVHDMVNTFVRVNELKYRRVFN
jgi:hypothetical protein